MKKRGVRRLFSFLLVLCVVFSMAAVAFAEGATEIEDDDINEVERILNEILPSDIVDSSTDNPGGGAEESPSYDNTSEDNPLPGIVSSDDTQNPYEPEQEAPKVDDPEPSDNSGDGAVSENPADTGVVAEPVDLENIDNPFKDVKADDYFFLPVMWAVEKEITKGKYYNAFAPEATCSRAEAVTFLWRANGKPEPKSYKHDFRDIESGAYYYKAVLWATENGITDGTSKKTFSPEAKCTRGQIVTFLYRALNSGDVEYSYTDKFVDVANDAYYAQAVSWAVDNKITEGTSEKTFSPDDYCTRAQIVTFLYRSFATIV